MTTPILGIGHVALRVPDLEASVTHATAILGLREVERQNGTVYLTCNEQHHAMQLIASDVAALDHVALQATSLPALEKLSTTLHRAGIPVLSETSQEPGLAHALRFLAPAGHMFEVFVPHIPESFQERERDGYRRQMPSTMVLEFVLDDSAMRCLNANASKRCRTFSRMSSASVSLIVH
jgi:catechol 2,3-dioxygenase-like lactoylglutathione lyase family enzyme